MNETKMENRPQLKRIQRPVNRPARPNAQNVEQQQRPMQTPPQRTPIKQTPVQRMAPNNTPNIRANAEREHTDFMHNQESDSEKTQELPTSSIHESFDLDKYLDSNDEHKNSPIAKKFLGEDEANKNREIAIEKQKNKIAQQQNKSSSDLGLPEYITKNVLILIGVGIFFAGIIITKLFFDSGTIVRNGLQGVIVNPEIPKGRARCGIAENMQGCVLYIMNPKRQELQAKEFFKLASELTGRQKFVIETGNMRYSNTKIRPGGIAQINVPPL